ncbi:MAG: hypothetical protein GY754_29970 [bacterium]|nr:hypothetical protein [bacterium]
MKIKKFTIVILFSIICIPAATNRLHGGMYNTQGLLCLGLGADYNLVNEDNISGEKKHDATLYGTAAVGSVSWIGLTGVLDIGYMPNNGILRSRIYADFYLLYVGVNAGYVHDYYDTMHRPGLTAGLSVIAPIDGLHYNHLLRFTIGGNFFFTGRTEFTAGVRFLFNFL